MLKIDQKIYAIFFPLSEDVIYFNVDKTKIN